jgi:hypothetical protein
VGLDISPRVSWVGEGELFVLELLVRAGSQPVSSVELTLSFDPTALQVVDPNGDPVDHIEGDQTALGQVLWNLADNDTGRIEYDAGLALPPGPAPTGTFRVASVRFKLVGAPASRLLQIGGGSDAFYEGVALAGARGTAWLLEPGKVLSVSYLPLILR